MGLLHSSHPSARCEQAWFLFSVGAARRLLLVEARNLGAVSVLEWIWLQRWFSAELLTVQRGGPSDISIGIRSDSVEQVDYVDFVLDFVRPEHMNDPVWLPVFSASLSDAERVYAATKIQAAEARVDAPRVAPASANDGDKAEILAGKLQGALEGLGFPKPMVTKYVASVRSRISAEPIENLIRAGILHFTRPA